MKIGILKADSVLPQFVETFGDYPEMMIKRFGDNAPMDVSFTVYDVEHLHYPETIDACDGYVITGSKKSVYDDEDWIRTLEDYVRALHEVKKPLVGICFGHQLVAQALGGETRSAAVGWGVGVHSANVTRKKGFMQPPLDRVHVLVSHKDQVTRLPEGAECVASSDFCQNHMFVIGDHIFCLQGHPEFVKSYSKTLMEKRRELLGEQTFQAGLTSLEQSIDSDVLAVWIVSFLAGAAV